MNPKVKMAPPAPSPATEGSTRVRPLGLLLMLGLSAGVAAPASAQWIRVDALPASDVFSVRTHADTIVAGTDTSVFVSTNAGAAWRRSSKPVPGVMDPIGAVLVLNHRLYAGTFGQGVFVSDDLGTTWQAFNQGLVGGLFDSQLSVSDFEVRGDSLLVATADGIFVRRPSVADTWHHFGDAFELNQAANVSDLALGNARLFACAGDNGMAFVRDPGDADWTVSTFANGPLVPGLIPGSAIFTGSRWVVGTNSGVFLSPNGRDSWAPSNTNFSGMKGVFLASSGPRLFIGFNSFNNFSLSQSQDNGTTWTPVETVPNTFGGQLAVQGSVLYAARSDGLWFRSTGTVSVGAGGEPDRLRFAVVGRQPVRDSARLHFELPRASAVAIEVFDVAGRRAGDRIEGALAAGTHDLTLDTRGLAPGVYQARLTAGGVSETARLVCVR